MQAHTIAPEFAFEYRLPAVVPLIVCGMNLAFYGGKAWLATRRQQ